MWVIALLLAIRLSLSCARTLMNNARIMLKFWCADIAVALKIVAYGTNNLSQVCCFPAHVISTYIFTARKRRFGQGNVFTPVCLCLQEETRCCDVTSCYGQHPYPWTAPPLTVPPPSPTGQHSPPPTVNKRAVRILLECVLVILCCFIGSVFWNFLVKDTRVTFAEKMKWNVHLSKEWTTLLRS